MKKILILAPHEDDELILCGSFLKEMAQANDVYIVFLTNGDYTPEIGFIRLEEALKVGTLYGVAEKNIIFLGYANEYDAKGPHIYNADNNEIVSSQYGNKFTYGLDNHPEYCFMRENIHHVYSRENIKADLKNVLSDIMPDVIFATDIEVHPDHKANSLLLDEVMGEILKENNSYSPIILKKPGYTTSWNSVQDYTDINNKSSRLLHSNVRTNGHISHFDNPYLQWDKRVRLPVGANERITDKKENYLYKALLLYESQNAVQHYEKLNNSDVVFWQRRTDSLTYMADVSASSGCVDYINDFKLVDSSSIKRTASDEWYADSSIWRPDPDDVQPWIEFEFENCEEIAEVVIYQEFFPKSAIENSYLVFDDEKIIEIGKLAINHATRVSFAPRKAQKIRFVINSVSDSMYAPGITEIEIFNSKKADIILGKVMVNDEFVYEYHIPGEFSIPIKVYEYYDDGTSYKADLDNYYVSIKKDHRDKNSVKLYGSRLSGNITGNVAISIKNKDNPLITDEIMLIPDIREHTKHPFSLEQIEEKFNSSIADRIAQMSYGEYRKNMQWYVKEFIRGFICEEYKREPRTKKKIYFIGTPDHYNIGDHAITVATYGILHDMLAGYDIEEIHIQQFARKFPYLLNNIRRDDLIILQGGGNMGNIYWRNERIRREIIKHFPDNKKIIFPETIYYDETEDGKTDFELSRKIYRDKNTIIFARENESYKIMKKAYCGCRIYLVPDIVCRLAPYPVKKYRSNVGLCYRNDLEKGINENEKEIIDRFILKNKDEKVYFDMMYNSKGYIGKANREFVVDKKIQEIASYKYVVTDRLHGMILCYITGTPCLVISKYNHKIKSFYKTWFRDVQYIRFVNNDSELEQGLEYISNMDACIPEEKNFNVIEQALEEWK